MSRVEKEDARQRALIHFLFVIFSPLLNGRKGRRPTKGIDTARACLSFLSISIGRKGRRPTKGIDTILHRSIQHPYSVEKEDARQRALINVVGIDRAQE